MKIVISASSGASAERKRNGAYSKKNDEIVDAVLVSEDNRPRDIRSWDRKRVDFVSLMKTLNHLVGVAVVSAAVGAMLILMVMIGYLFAIEMFDIFLNEPAP